MKSSRTLQNLESQKGKKVSLLLRMIRLVLVQGQRRKEVRNLAAKKTKTRRRKKRKRKRKKELEEEG